MSFSYDRLGRCYHSVYIYVCIAAFSCVATVSRRIKIYTTSASCNWVDSSQADEPSVAGTADDERTRSVHPSPIHDCSEIGPARVPRMHCTECSRATSERHQPTTRYCTPKFSRSESRRSDICPPDTPWLGLGLAVTVKRWGVSKKVKGSSYSITERRVPELIPVLGSDVNNKPDGRLPLLSSRPAVTPATLKTAATNFAAW